MSRTALPDRLTALLENFLATLILAIFVEVLLIIFTRQFSLSWVWLYDVTRWTLAWLVFLGAVPLAARRAHLTVDLAAGSLAPWVRVLGQILSGACTAIVAGLVAYFGALEAFRMFESGERSMSGALPAFVGYSVLPLAFSLVALVVLAQIGVLFDRRPAHLSQVGDEK